MAITSLTTVLLSVVPLNLTITKSLSSIKTPRKIFSSVPVFGLNMILVSNPSVHC